MDPRGRGARVFAVLVAVSLVATPIGVATPVEPTAGAMGGGSLQVDDPTPANDTTRHEDPRDVDERGDLGAVRRWLAGRMTVELERCVVQVGIGETDICEFEDEYPDWLERYIDVADETGDEADDRTAERFDQAAAAAESYSRNVSAFRRTYAAYQEASQAGNTTQARALARELLELQESVESTGGALSASIAAIGRAEGVDVSTARSEVNETVADSAEVVESVAAEQFVRTELSVELSPRTISFTEPGTVTGQLSAANGTPLADREVRLQIGSQTVTTRTDSDGRFAVTYRPTALRSDAEAVPVTFRPPPGSIYLESTARVPVRVTPVEPTVTVTVDPATARFGETISAAGTVTAAGIGASGVPVLVTVDGRRAGLVETDGSGQFTLSSAIEADDGPGDVVVGARIAFEGRALAVSGGTASLRVEQTATALELNASASGSERIQISGSLHTTGGMAVPDQPVTIRLNGEAVEAVRSGPDGAFEVAVQVSAVEASADARLVAVSAAFEGAGTNLGASSAQSTVTLEPAVREPGRPSWISRNAGPLVAVGLIALLLLALAGWRYGLGGGGEPAADAGPPVEATGAPDHRSRGKPTTASLLEIARQELSSDADGAVMLAYAAVRTALTSSTRAVARTEAATHWEFLVACRRDGLDEATIERLTRVTEAYERAAFAPEGVSSDEAATAIETAEGLL